jgi:SAM-dependent methyltransferase
MLCPAEIFRSIDATRRGLEIGPLDQPVLDRSLSNIRYVDHLDREGLQRKYRGNSFVDTGRIVDLDYVTRNASLPATIGYERFDYIVASHVIEHVPDLIGFLGECADILADGGVLSLIIPDKTYSFDVRRRLSTFPDALSAWIERRRTLSVRDICDHYLEVVQVSPEQLWQGIDVAGLQNYHSYEEAMELVAAGHSDTRFIDCHVWVFTHDSFVSLLRKCILHTSLNFEILHTASPIQGEMDFYCSLMKHDCRRRIDDR